MSEKIIKLYAVRVTVPRTFDETAIQFCKKYSKVYAIGAEVGKETEKPHYHFYLESATSRQTLTNNLKKMFGVSGNEGFELVIAKFPLQYKAYVAKEFLLAHQGIDWDKVPAYTKYESKRESKAKVRSPTFAAQMLIDYGSRVLSPRSICQWVMEYFKERTKIFDQFIIFRFANLLVATSCPQGWENLKTSWSEKFAQEQNNIYGIESKCQSKGLSLGELLDVDAMPRSKGYDASAHERMLEWAADRS